MSPPRPNGNVIPFQDPISDDGEAPESLESRVGRIEGGLIRIEARLEVAAGHERAQDDRIEQLTDLAMTRIVAASQQATSSIVQASQQAHGQMTKRIVIPVGAVTALATLIQFLITHFVK